MPQKIEKGKNKNMIIKEPYSYPTCPWKMGTLEDHLVMDQKDFYELSYSLSEFSDENI
jgi:hypothetical protein